MDTSILLARMIGPLFLAVAIGALLDRDHYQGMTGDFLGNRALYFISGGLALIGGIAIVSVHNLWTADWRVIITLIGWMAIIQGAARLVMPSAGANMARRVAGMRGMMLGGIIFALVIGAVLSFVGFFSIF